MMSQLPSITTTTTSCLNHHHHKSCLFSQAHNSIRKIAPNKTTYSKCSTNDTQHILLANNKLQPVNMFTTCCLILSSLFLIQSSIPLAMVSCQLVPQVAAAQKPQNESITSSIKHNHPHQSNSQPSAADFIHHHHQHQHHNANREQPVDVHSSSILDYVRATGGGQQVSSLLDTHDSQHHHHQEKIHTYSDSLLKTYIRTNNMRAYHLDLHSYRDEAKYVGDPAHIDSHDIYAIARCQLHLDQYQQLLNSFSDMDPVADNISLDSIKLADLFGRPEAGSLLGNQFWLGSYDSCLDFEHNSIKAQYCLGISQFPNWNPSDSKTSIKIGLCLPETCTSSMFNENRDTLLKQAEIMMKYQFNHTRPFNKLTLRQVYCLPHESSQIRQYSKSALGFCAFIGFFVAMCLITTAIDYFNTKLPQDGLTSASPTTKDSVQLTNQQERRRSWRTIVLESFSLIRNFDKFMSIREEAASSSSSSSPATSATATPQQQVQENQLNDDEGNRFDRSLFLSSTTGLKCIGLFWIICAHTFLVAPIPSKNLIEADKLTQTYLADIYLTAHLIVDTFFALSGLLASYFLFKHGLNRIKTSEWIVLTVHRYWRLTPIYLICYWYSKSVGFLTNSGPLWDYMTAEQSPRLNCNRESWWEAILHLSDFKSPKEHCVPFAWFIANGIKFWMVTPFFLLLINKSMRRGYMVTMWTILANIVLVGYLALKSNVDIKSVIEFKPESADNMLNNMGEIYTRPYSRIGAYLIGLLAGHLMYLVDTNQVEIKLSKNTKIILWSLFSFTTIVLAFILKIAGGIELDEAVLPYIFSISSALIRPLWALCTCWFVFALAHGQARWISRFLSANFWRLLVKLSFCAYLAQGEVIAQLFLSPSTVGAFTYQDLLTKPILAITLTLALSFFMVLFLEYPLHGIEVLILPSKQSQQQQQEKTKTSSCSQQTPPESMVGGDTLMLSQQVKHQLTNGKKIDETTLKHDLNGKISSQHKLKTT